MPFLANDALDRVDGHRMPFGDQIGAAFSMEVFQFEIPLVENDDEVRRRSFGFAREARTVVKHDHGFAGLRKEIRRGQPGHPSADDTDTNIGALIFGEARESGPLGRGHPNRRRTSGMSVYGMRDCKSPCHLEGKRPTPRCIRCMLVHLPNIFAKK